MNQIRIDPIEQAKLDMEGVLSTPQGKRTLYRILEMCGVYSVSPVVNGETGLSLGRRQIGVSIIGMIDDVERTAYHRMMIEIYNEQQAIQQGSTHETESND